MAETAPPTSIADRIAALKLNQVGRLPQPAPTFNQPHSNGQANGYANRTTNGAARRPPPPLPNRRSESTHSLTSPSAALSGKVIGNEPAATPTKAPVTRAVPALPPRRNKDDDALPALPPRRPSESPSLPARRPSGQISRRGSRESISSTTSGYSIASNKTGASSMTSSSAHMYAVRAPSYDPSALPPLPPKRTIDKPRDKSPEATLTKTVSSPVLPQRPTLPQRQTIAEQPNDAGRRLEPPPPSRKSALLQGFSQGNDKPPALPGARPGRETAPPPSLKPLEESQDISLPPPIPTASRPDLAQLKLSKPKPSTTSSHAAPSAAPQSDCCLTCRDFSAPDNHAARFPRESIPSHEPAWLAHQLTAPFTSETDKARAIFTWLHHNVAYDVVSFFNNDVKPSTPSGTLTSGLAVCEGYAGLFTALALMSGLESRVISGHGKGGTYHPPMSGAPLPPYEMGHAWSAVRIDGGKWKLIDPCWGAGSVCANDRKFTKRFSPRHFTMSNEEFGQRHFPEDKADFYQAGGQGPSWEEYLLCDDGIRDWVQVFSGYATEEGISDRSFAPRGQNISLSAERQKGMTRFSFGKICQHWDNEKSGKGKHYCYILNRQDKKPVPFQYNGKVWWLDIPSHELGQPGQFVQISAVNKFNNADARGLTAEKFMAGGRSMSWGGVCRWSIVA
ncbi:hypothetical protein ANO11243_070560 [Dothideomycetidae sp. 11243]|nr:hypothetical protein ANO11243_070560 [fungal sp. No.11243]